MKPPVFMRNGYVCTFRACLNPPSYYMNQPYAVRRATFAETFMWMIFKKVPVLRDDEVDE